MGLPPLGRITPQTGKLTAVPRINGDKFTPQQYDRSVNIEVRCSGGARNRTRHLLCPSSRW